MSLNYQPAPRLSEIVRQVQQSLVHIRTDSGSGSGFVIDSAGYIITNAHVVGNHRAVELELVDGTTLAGLVLGRDEELDLACITVSSTHALTPVTTGDSDSEQVGEDVIAMGYPLGDMLRETPSVTKGIISAKRVDALQTDAAINPGNSGGPLINPFGHVIGVNTSRYEQVGGRNITGINFAIPINVVNERLDFLKQGGVAGRRPYLDDGPEDEEWTIHDVGELGFSITLPSWWERYDSDSSNAFFGSEPIRISISLVRVEEDSSLYPFASAQWFHSKGQARQWQRGQLFPLKAMEPATGWAFEYEGQKLDYQEHFRGKFFCFPMNSPTGSTHCCSLQVETTEGGPKSQLGLDHLAENLKANIAVWDTYWSDIYEWNIAAAPGWMPTEYNEDELTLWAPDDGPAYLSLLIFDLPDDLPVDELCEQVVSENLDSADAWNRYEIVSAHEDDYGDHDWYRINYRYQGRDDQEPSLRIVQVGRSESIEYVLIADMSEMDVGLYATEIDYMIASFRF